MVMRMDVDIRVKMDCNVVSVVVTARTKPEIFFGRIYEMKDGTRYVLWLDI